MIKLKIKLFLQFLGWNLSRVSIASDKIYSLSKALSESDKYFDVGCNNGQFFRLLMDIGLSRKSTYFMFDPLPLSYLPGLKKIVNRARIKHYQLGIATVPGELILNVSENLVSSSFLEAEQDYKSNVLKNKSSIDTITCRVDKLENYIEGSVRNAFLKIDAQGMELDVVKSASSKINCFRYIFLESSFKGSYQGQASFEELYTYLSSKGFILIGVYPGYLDKLTGEYLEFDALFKVKDK